MIEFLASTAGVYDDPSDFCSFEYGQMKDIDAAIEEMNVNNIYNNIDSIQSTNITNIDAEYDSLISRWYGRATT